VKFVVACTCSEDGGQGFDVYDTPILDSLSKSIPVSTPHANRFAFVWGVGLSVKQRTDLGRGPETRLDLGTCSELSHLRRLGLRRVPPPPVPAQPVPVAGLPAVGERGGQELCQPPDVLAEALGGAKAPGVPRRVGGLAGARALRRCEGQAGLRRRARQAVARGLEVGRSSVPSGRRWGHRSLSSSPERCTKGRSGLSGGAAERWLTDSHRQGAEQTLWRPRAAMSDAGN